MAGPEYGLPSTVGETQEMTSYEFYLSHAPEKLVDEWPNWCVACEGGSSWHFSRTEADEQMKHCTDAGVKARVYRVEFE